MPELRKLVPAYVQSGQRPQSGDESPHSKKSRRRGIVISKLMVN